MSEKIDTVRSHIPEDLFDHNLPLEKFVAVFQGMMDIRKEEIFNYTRSFLFPLVHDIRIMRRYVDEWKAEYTELSSRLCLECLYNNYYQIYSRKGTELGLKRLLKCLLMVDREPEEITIREYSLGKPLILSDNDRFYDALPNEADIAAEVLAPAGQQKWTPTLLGKSWDEHYTRLNIAIHLNYVPTPSFIAFIKKVILLYIPMANPDFTILTLNFI